MDVIFFQFIHHEDDDKLIDVNGKLVYLFRVYCSEERLLLVSQHFTRIVDQTMTSVGEATAEAANTIAAISTKQATTSVARMPIFTLRQYQSSSEEWEAEQPSNNSNEHLKDVDYDKQEATKAVTTTNNIETEVTTNESMPTNDGLQNNIAAMQLLLRDSATMYSTGNEEHLMDSILEPPVVMDAMLEPPTNISDTGPEKTLLSAAEPDDDASVILIGKEERNALLAEKRWVPATVRSPSERKKAHTEWYKLNIMVSQLDMQLKIGYYVVKYPSSVLNYEENKKTISKQNEIAESEENCVCCLSQFRNGDRICYTSSFSNLNPDDRECNHLYCQECAYRWYLRLPAPQDYTTIYINKYINKYCNMCNGEGHLRKSMFNSEKIMIEYPDDWKKGHLVPDNRAVWLVHQVPYFDVLNFITSPTLAFAIKKIEKKNSRTGIPDQRQAPLRNVEEIHHKKYDLYATATTKKFMCSECVKSYYCIEKYVGKNCKKECTRQMCLHCCAARMVNNWGSHKGGSELKYLQGHYCCDYCKQKGRIVHQLTGAYFTKYLD